MKRTRWFLLSGAFLACSGSPDETEKSVAGALDYSKWPCLTTEPFLNPYFTLCAPPDPLMDTMGPHSTGMAKYYANTVAVPALRGARGLMPVNSIVVKEKLRGWDVPPVAYAAMIKRAPGYDPANGDWEYSYVSLPNGKRFENGNLGNCRECHQKRKSQDYLFLTYFKP